MLCKLVTSDDSIVMKPSFLTGLGDGINQKTLNWRLIKMKHETNETKTLEIQEHGVMMVDYFSGTPGVMLPLYIDKNTTCKEVLDMLEDEIDMVWEHIEYVAGYHEYPLGDLEFRIAEQMADMCDYVMKAGKMNLPFNGDLDFSFEELDDADNYDETPVAIFTIEFN